MPQVSQQEMDQLVWQMFCREGAPRGRYPAPGDEPPRGEELIGGTLFRYQLLDPDEPGQRVTLQLYLNVSELGGRLWEQETRVLLRAGTTRHPALPEVIEGDCIDDSEAGISAAYVITRGGGHYQLDDPDAIPYMRSDRGEAVRQFSLLADGLSILHGLGIVHRNIWPGTIDVEMSPAGEAPPQLRLSRFEMSLLVNNLLRSATLDAAKGDQVRKLLAGQGARAAVYCPPERLAILYPGGRNPTGEGEKSDVFSLAAVVAEWFVGPYPSPEPDETDIPGWARRVQAGLRRDLRRATQVPEKLTKLLGEMLGETPKFRPDARAVVTRIRQHYDAMTMPDAPESEQPYLLAVAPRDCGGPLHKMGLLNNSPEVSQGRRELTELIERDLRRPQLYYAPSGAEGLFRDGDPKSKREAQQVLVGEQMLWYCRPFRERPESPFAAGEGKVIDEVLAIRYVVPRAGDRARAALKNLRRKGSSRSVPAVEAITFEHAQSDVDRIRANRPSWLSLISLTKSAAGLIGGDLIYDQALRWLLDYLWTELRAQEYPYVRVQVTGQQAVLQFDEARDAARTYQSALSTVYAQSEQRRPMFGDFFQNVADDEGIEVVADDGGEPASPRQFAARARFVAKPNRDAIRVEVAGGADQLPESGWVRPVALHGSRVALQRQEDACRELLENNPVLLSQLKQPLTIRGRPQPWQQAGAGLDDDGPKAVQNMLRTQPFFALQGPPGTGKTTVTAHALNEYFRREADSRVLVSAQSNFALDNLAERVLRITDCIDEHGKPARDTGLVALRAVSATGADRVAGTLKPYLLDVLTKRQRQQLLDHAKQEKAVRTDQAARDLLDRWINVLAECGPELSDRLRRGANVVFATCSTATPKLVAASSEAAVFDWVIIEEAAKAWPTELAIPLVRGLRWTLVGDHHQLPAHRKREVERFLRECAAEKDADLAVHGQHWAEYQKVFDLFGELFKARDGRSGQSLRQATAVLVDQYRMRDPICQVVSRVFYPATPSQAGQPLPPGLLRTKRAERPHGLSAPGWVRGQALVWLDTSEITDRSGDEGTWSNATEAGLCREFVAALRPPPARPAASGDSRELAVLTPYRDQQKLLSDDPVVQPFVSTIHAFQGRQADIVVVSLVRDTRRGGQPWHNIGYLTEPELVNVMLSRARNLLVIIGDYAHFMASDVEFWRQACESVQRFGVVVSAQEVRES